MMWDLGNGEHASPAYPVSRNRNEPRSRTTSARQDSYPYASAPYIVNAPSQASPHGGGVPYQSPYLQHSTPAQQPGGFLLPPQSPRQRRHSDSLLARPQMPHQVSTHSSPDAHSHSRDPVVVQTMQNQHRGDKLKKHRHTSSQQTYAVNPNQIIRIAPESAGLPLIIQNGRIVSGGQSGGAHHHATKHSSHQSPRPAGAHASRPHQSSRPAVATAPRPPHQSSSRPKKSRREQEDLDRGLKENAQKFLSLFDIDFEYSKCTGRRKALCIGINYLRSSKSERLNGCINDALNLRKKLIQRFRYKPEDIVVLRDDSDHPRSLPTRKNMIDAMKWLVKDAHPHDSLVFHYSGHGGQVPDLDGDEVDGQDEVIFPMDHEKYGVLVDDELHDIMVSPLPKGCRLTAIFDSCHSGTVLDIPFIYSSHGRLKQSLTHPSAIAKKSSSADVISWAGCQDGQTSADTFTAGKSALAVGAMSHAFIKTLEENPKLTYLDLLNSLRRKLYSKYSQRPQLTSSHPIDTSLEFIM